MLQIGNMIDNHWTLGENMKKPYGIHLGTSILKKSHPPPFPPKGKN